MWRYTPSCLTMSRLYLTVTKTLMFISTLRHVVLVLDPEWSSTVDDLLAYDTEAVHVAFLSSSRWPSVIETQQFRCCPQQPYTVKQVHINFFLYTVWVQSLDHPKTLARQWTTSASIDSAIHGNLSRINMKDVGGDNRQTWRVPSWFLRWPLDQLINV